MAYIPSPTDINQPADTVDRSTAALEFRTLKAYIAGLLVSFVPKQAFTGEIKIWSGLTATIPAGWYKLPTVATTLSRTTYPDLHTFMQSNGYPYGSGDGSSTFGIPHIPAGYAVANADGDLTVGVVSTGDVKAHTHTIASETITAATGPYIIPFEGRLLTSSTNSTGGDANLAASVSFYYIIKT